VVRYKNESKRRFARRFSILKSSVKNCRYAFMQRKYITEKHRKPSRSKGKAGSDAFA